MIDKNKRKKFVVRVFVFWRFIPAHLHHKQIRSKWSGNIMIDIFVYEECTLVIFPDNVVNTC